MDYEARDTAAGGAYIFKAYNEFNDWEDGNDLYVVSLRFRLLRQDGYHVSASEYRIKFY